MAIIQPQKSKNWLAAMHPLVRISMGVVMAAIVFFIIPRHHIDFLPLAMLLWDVFALSFIISGVIVMFVRSVPEIRQQAQKDDGSKAFVLMMILVASFVSMFAVLLLFLAPKNENSPIVLPVAIAGMMLSWILVHLIFTFHYAHMYYGDDKEDPKKHLEGLEFPKEDKPDYIDFAYFAFVLGTTFQVSDVEISSRKIRRMALVHGLLSFGLNTFVVALTINLVAGLKK